MIEVLAKQVGVEARRNDLGIHSIHRTCRCWRCRVGGVSKLEMSQLDRILARHLLRMNDTDRLNWLHDWEQNPNHGEWGRSALERWMAIEQGRRIAEPVYYVRTGT